MTTWGVPLSSHPPLCNLLSRNALWLWVQIILRGVGHAALHDPGEVDLRKLISSSVLYDDILLARVLKSKGAKLASERRYKVKNSTRCRTAHGPIFTAHQLFFVLQRQIVQDITRNMTGLGKTRTRKYLIGMRAVSYPE